MSALTPFEILTKRILYATIVIALSEKLRKAELHNGY